MAAQMSKDVGTDPDTEPVLQIRFTDPDPAPYDIYGTGALLGGSHASSS